MAKRTLWPWINLAVTIATIAINSLAEALPINGLSTGEISDSYPIYFVPAGYVFSIWGVIYLALIAFSIYQVLPSQRANVHIQRIGVLYTLTGAANVAWIFLWHYERFLVTVPVILVLLGSLIAIFLKLWSGRASLTTADRWAIYVPFSIYLGWASVATVANVSQLLYYLNWGGWGISPVVWAVVMLVVAAAIAVVMSLRHANVSFAAVFVWAYIGIAVKQSGTPTVSITAAVLAGVILAALIVSLPRRRRLWAET